MSRLQHVSAVLIVTALFIFSAVLTTPRASAAVDFTSILSRISELITEIQNFNAAQAIEAHAPDVQLLNLNFAESGVTSRELSSIFKLYGALQGTGRPAIWK